MMDARIQTVRGTAVIFAVTRLLVCTALLMSIQDRAWAAEKVETEPGTQTRVVRDALWVWGNPEMGKESESTLAQFAHSTPGVRARLLGVPNIVMAGSGFPHDPQLAAKWSEDAASANQVVWELISDGHQEHKPPFAFQRRVADLSPLVRKYPQIQAVLIDDMSSVAAREGFQAQHLQSLKSLLKEEQLPLELWGVLYTMNFALPTTPPLIEELDVINLWHWHARETVVMERNVAECERQYPEKPIVLGLYMYDYGENRPMPLDLHQQQCDTALRLLKAGRVQGIVFLSINDDPDVIGWTADWIARVGEAPLAELSTTSNLSNDGDAPLPDGARKLTAGRKQVLAEGAAWGAIATLNDGSLAVTIQRAQPDPQIDAAAVDIEWMKSTDGGRTWSKPTTVYAPRGPNGSISVRRDDGGSIVYQARNQAIGQLPDGRILCSFCVLHYHYTPTGEEEPRPNASWNHENQGIYCTWSEDGGATWCEPKRVDINPFGGEQPMISPHWRIVPLASGEVLMSIYGRRDSKYDGPLELPAEAQTMAGVLRSRDRGETWGEPSIIMTKAGDLPWEETSLLLVAEDRLLAHVRTEQHSVDQYVSTDGGRTWSGAERFTEPGQQPGGAFRLQSGLLVGTWGNRRPPFGAAAMLSRDDGQTWDYQHRASIEWKASGPDCGYANGAQAGDGTVAIIYYIMGDHSSYRNLWGRSKVYLVTCTEDELKQAMQQPADTTLPSTP